jgi:hypothetical protein
VKENAIVYTITRKSELLNVVQVMNGFLRTPKIQEFNALLNYLISGKNKNTVRDQYLLNKAEGDSQALGHVNKVNILQHTVDQSSLFDNYWLAGFIDADGGFKIRYTAKQIHEKTGKVLTKERIELKFVLEQRQFHRSQAGFQSIMEQLVAFMAVNLRISKHKERHYWIVEVSSLLKLERLVDYLSKYPLCTAKINDYKDWLKVYHIMKESHHLTESGKSEIISIKSNMNKKRVVFDWSHLK